MAVKIIVKGLVGGWPLIWMAAAIMSLSSCSRKSQDDDYLIRVGNSSISVTEFKRAVEATSEEAFPGDPDISPSALNDLRMRVLNQLTDELIIIERAAVLGIHVSEQELETAIKAVKADYPDDTFEKTLLENAVSFQAWKQKLATRLLIDKVIAKELVDKVEITSKDVAIYFQNHFPKGIPEGEDPDQFNKRIVQHLRQQKAEALYHGWIESLRKTFPVEVHEQRWSQLIEANA